MGLDRQEDPLEGENLSLKLDWDQINKNNHLRARPCELAQSGLAGARGKLAKTPSLFSISRYE